MSKVLLEGSIFYFKNGFYAIASEVLDNKQMIQLTLYDCNGNCLVDNSANCLYPFPLSEKTNCRGCVKSLAEFQRLDSTIVREGHIFLVQETGERGFQFEVTEKGTTSVIVSSIFGKKQVQIPLSNLRKLRSYCVSEYDKQLSISRAKR